MSVLVIARWGVFSFGGEVEGKRCVGNGSALSSSQTVKVDGGKGRGPAHLPNESLLAGPISPAGQVEQASG